MKIKIFILFIILITGFNLFSQRHIINENVDDYKFFTNQKYGIKGTHFFWYYIGLGFYTPNPFDNHINTTYGLTNNFSFGLKYKLQIFKWLSFGADLNYNFDNFKMKSPFLYHSFYYEENHEKLIVNNTGSEVFLRFFIGKNNNIMGKFFDLGVTGSYVFSNKHIIKIKGTEPNYFFSESQKIINKNVSYISDFQYGGVFRFGYNNLSFYVKYRLSDLFTKHFIQTISTYDLPKLSVGVEVNVY